MNRSVLVVLAFVGVFLAGGVSGGLVGARISDNLAHQKAAELFAQQQFRRLGDQLGLTAEQRQRIRPIITKAGQDVQAHRREILSIASKMEADVRQELTEEQRQQFDRVRNRMRDNERLLQRWIREQRARRQDPTTNAPATPSPAP